MNCSVGSPSRTNFVRMEAWASRLRRRRPPISTGLKRVGYAVSPALTRDGVPSRGADRFRVPGGVSLVAAVFAGRRRLPGVAAAGLDRAQHGREQPLALGGEPGVVLVGDLVALDALAHGEAVVLEHTLGDVEPFAQGRHLGGEFHDHAQEFVDALGLEEAVAAAAGGAGQFFRHVSLLAGASGLLPGAEAVPARALGVHAAGLAVEQGGLVHAFAEGRFADETVTRQGGLDEVLRSETG